MSTILAFLFPFGAAKRAATYDHDERCNLCVAKKHHGPADHDEAIFESYRGIGEP